MGNTESTEGGANRGRFELWVHFGNWSGEPGMGTPDQVAEDYGLEYERFEGDAGVVAVWEGASRTDARYEGPLRSTSGAPRGGAPPLTLRH